MIPHRVTGKHDYRAYGAFALLAVSVLFFLWEVFLTASTGKPIDSYFKDYALQTCDVAGQSFGDTMIDAVRSIFMHKTAMSFLMYMVFLWVFAPLVEQFFGTRRFLLFFFVAGFGGHILSILFNRSAANCLSLVGPGGAIAGVMGAFIWLYPAKRVETFIPFMARKFDFPALFFVFLYFALSIFVTEKGPLSGELQPYWDEIGGFATGLIFVFLATMFKPAPKGDPLEHLD